MKREELEKLGLTAEQVEAAMRLYGRDTTELRRQISEANDKVESLTSSNASRDNASKELLEKITKLEESLNASAAKYNELSEAFNDSKRQREAEQRQAALKARFDAATEGKSWTHTMVRDAYMRKFSHVADSDEYKGKTDDEIITALTKDDAAAFSTPKGVKLPTSKPVNSGIDKAAFNKMNYSERLKLFNENPELYKTFVGKD